MIDSVLKLCGSNYHKHIFSFPYSTIFLITTGPSILQIDLFPIFTSEKGGAVARSSGCELEVPGLSSNMRTFCSD